MTIEEVYRQYPVNCGLQEHMIQVAAVAKMLGDNSPALFDREVVVLACLLHDIGNLIKTKFDLCTDQFEPEGVAYWQVQQVKMIERYGPSEHDATEAILAEINVSEPVRKLVNIISFQSLADVMASDSLAAKIVEYADMRVKITGITTLRGRYDDLIERYASSCSAAEFEVMYQIVKKFENEFFAGLQIKPDDITDKSTASIQSELWKWEVKV